MAAFDRSLREHRLVSADLEQEVCTPVRLTGGRTEGYGFGWVLTSYCGVPVVSHAGGIDGFSSFYACFPGQDTSIVILSNRGNFDGCQLAREITDEVLALPASPLPAALPHPLPEGLAGTYRDTLAAAELSAIDGRLLASHAGVTRRMTPISATAFTDENDHDVRLHAHSAREQPAAITIEYPFTWFTGYR